MYNYIRIPAKMLVFSLPPGKMGTPRYPLIALYPAAPRVIPPGLILAVLSYDQKLLSKPIRTSFAATDDSTFSTQTPACILFPLENVTLL